MTDCHCIGNVVTKKSTLDEEFAISKCRVLYHCMLEEELHLTATCT
jgi:hypothetical protein